MVEMVETAAILNQAGERALVILDEIGRGTATFDGLSIAWATVEHLHDVNKCRALFATHFHELTALAARLDRLHNATVRVKEWQGEVVFLHEVVAGRGRPLLRHPGGEARRPAGERDRTRQASCWPSSSRKTAPRRKASRTCRCSRCPTRPAPSERRTPRDDLLAAALAALNPDDLSPREAMEALYRLKEQAAKKRLERRRLRLMSSVIPGA